MKHFPICSAKGKATNTFVLPGSAGTIECFIWNKAAWTQDCTRSGQFDSQTRIKLFQTMVRKCLITWWTSSRKQSSRPEGYDWSHAETSSKAATSQMRCGHANPMRKRHTTKSRDPDHLQEMQPTRALCSRVYHCQPTGANKPRHSRKLAWTWYT